MTNILKFILIYHSQNLYLSINQIFNIKKKKLGPGFIYSAGPGRQSEPGVTRAGFNQEI